MPGPHSLKSKIEAERDRLQTQLAEMNRTLDIITLFETSAGATNGHRPAHAEAADKADDKAPRKRSMSPQARKAISRRMKAYWKGRRQTV